MLGLPDDRQLPHNFGDEELDDWAVDHRPRHKST
jgi:hypothetical protein